jgi:chitinase
LRRGIYAANMQPSNISANDVTTLLYSFADVKSDGTIGLTDSYADEQKHYPGDSWDERGNNIYGCLKQSVLLARCSTAAADCPIGFTF